MRLDYSWLINKKFNLLTVVAIGPKRLDTGEQLFYCNCDCGSKNHLASKFQLVKNKLKSCGCLRKDSENIIGNIYDRLAVVEKSGRNNQKGQLFLCNCVCGNTITTTKSKLKHEEVKSCGCLLKEIKDKYSDLLGKKFGDLTVTKRLGPITERRDIFWLCSCKCGNVTKATTGNLTHGNTKTCGCSREKFLRKYRKSVGKDPDIAITSERKCLRKRIRTLGLATKVFIRDDYTCQLCNIRGCALQAHHIIPVNVDDTIATDINNMITLCVSCHKLKAHLGGNQRKIDEDIQQKLQNLIK